MNVSVIDCIEHRMKTLILSLSAFCLTVSFHAQMTSSVAKIVTVYSENEQFYLRSIPHDNKSPSLRGVTHIFASGESKPIYTLDRGFDSVGLESNNLVLSNDGDTILFFIPWGAEESKDGLKSISIYRRGELIRSYTAAEITGCDLNKERCDALYSNFDEVVDKEKSNFGSAAYRRVFKPGISDAEKFLNDFPIFTHGDTVYITDSKKTVHRFSLSEGKLIDSKPFDTLFNELRSIGRFNKVVLDSFEAPLSSDFPKLTSGADTSVALGKTFGMTPYNIYSRADEKYKRYSLTVSGYLNRDGGFEITELDVNDGLPEQAIRDFFSKTRFRTELIPRVVDRWFLSEKYFFFRRADSRLAIRERTEERKIEREELAKRLVSETIDDRYIPKDLGDAFEQLDKELPEVLRNEMKELETRDEMGKYHHGLGTWIRNNWGLWGGSRLQKYFTDRRVNHPDEMSGVILSFYWDWLHGRKETWKEWEKNPDKELQ
jgi:hypothetical protein